MTAFGKIILEGLGGEAFVTATGANRFTKESNKFSFRLPNRFAKDKINSVTVRLDRSGRYTMTFRRIWGWKSFLIMEVNDVFDDQLQEFFTEVTGLDCHP